MKAILKSNLVYLALFLSILGNYSCQSESSDIIDELRTICFDTEILPAFQMSCAAADCHSADAVNVLHLDSYEGILAGIEPGDAANSKIYKAIISTKKDHMPPEQTLSQESRTLIRVWIEQGALNSVCGSQGIDTSKTDTTRQQEPWSNPFVCFERDILPIMQSSCGLTGCHDPITRREEFNFTTYAGILKGLKAGDPLDSKIYKAITEDEAEDIMPPPPNKPLTRAQIDSIYNWILRGAPDEECGDACDTVNVNYGTHLEPLLAASCRGCHSGANPAKGIRLESYANLVAVINAGAIPNVLRNSAGYPLMPPGRQLSECNIRKFEIWIENGMPE